MTRAETLKVINELLRPTLRAQGFKDSAPTFRRRVGEVIQVVNFQWSMYSPQFTINFGIYWRTLGYLQTGQTIEKPKEYDCHERQRIGDILHGTDTWWPNNEVANACADVRTALPWLDEHSNPTSYAQRIEFSRKRFPLEHYYRPDVFRRLELVFLFGLTGDVSRAEGLLEGLRSEVSDKVLTRLVTYVSDAKAGIQ